MRDVSILGFLALVLAPMLHAELLPWVKGERRARILALSGSVAAFIISCVLAGSYYSAREIDTLYAHMSLGIGHHELHFVLDSLNGPLLPLLTLLTLAIVLGGPQSLLTRRELRALLWLEALSLLTLATADLAVLAIGFSTVLVPSYVLTTTKQSGHDRALIERVFKLYHGFGVLCFLSACLALGYFTRPSGFLDMSLLATGARSVPESVRPVLFGLLTVAALVRMGIAPLHSWLPVSLERGTLFAVALLVSVRTGFYVLARLAIPVFPAAAHAAMPILTTLALFSALYGALAALGQHDLRRMIGFLVVSQSGIMLTGLVFGDAHAVSGTLLYWLGFATATTGLVLMVSALAARTGSADMRDFGGIVRKVPNLSACFFLFGLATIAIPGTVAFVAEDMLVHGALEAHPMLTLVMIVAMVLNAITFVRAFMRTFLGERRPASITLGTLEDLLPRERLSAVVLLLALIIAGVNPGPVVAAQARAAKAIAHTGQHGPHGQP